MNGFGVFVLLLCIQQTWTFETHIEYAFSFKCGKQPVTGELIVQKGESELLKVNFNREHKNEFKETRKYMEFPSGAFKLILKTGCGALSKIGEFCIHKYTNQPFFQQHGTYKYFVFLDHIDLYSEIGNQTSNVELVCN